MSEGAPNWSAEWLSLGPESDVVISSRVRLARNLAGFNFVSRASKAERLQVMELAQQRIMSGSLASAVMWVSMADLPAVDRSVLVERHLISKQHAKGDEPRAVAISNPDERLSIMVNEEDHLRIQVIRAGLGLSDAFAQIDEVDDRLESQMDYAYSPRFGYLTACPTNVGTGIRVSVMLHLPALKMTGEIEKVRRAAKGMSLAVRGFYGEGSDAVGDFYQLSNQTTLGKTERGVLQEFEQSIVPKVVEYERAARRSLAEKRRAIFEDSVFRALGTLRHARLLKADEATTLLGLVRLGVATGVVEGVDLRTVNQLLLMTQPAHLQKGARKDLDQATRRVERARMTRTMLGGA